MTKVGYSLVRMQMVANSCVRVEAQLPTGEGAGSYLGVAPRRGHSGDSPRAERGRGRERRCVFPLMKVVFSAASGRHGVIHAKAQEPSRLSPTVSTSSLLAFLLYLAPLHGGAQPPVAATDEEEAEG
jgi:hypothetical protein